MKKHLAAAVLAASLALSTNPAPAGAMVFLEGPALSSPPSFQLPNPQQIIDGWLRQAQQLASKFVPGASPVPRPAAGSASVSQEQQALIDATNRHRARHGLGPLEPMAELNATAQDWANTMAQEDYLRHRPNHNASYPRGWRMSGENVIVWQPPQSADSLVQKLSTSPGHNAMMLRPDATHIGVGVAVNAAGHQYAVQNFAGY